MTPSPLSRTLRSQLDAIAHTVGATGVGDELQAILDQTFTLPAGDPNYGHNALEPGALPIELAFSEAAPTTLRVILQPFGPSIDPRERWLQARRVLNLAVARRFGSADAKTLDRSADQIESPPHRARFGAFVGACFDAEGLTEVKIYTELDRSSAMPLVELGLARLPLPAGCVPLLLSHAYTRAGVARRLYALCRGGLRLLDLEPLTAAVGLSDRFPQLVTTVLGLTGARSFLPADSTIIALRPTRDGVELKLELLPGALLRDPLRRRDAIEMHLGEDPGSLLAFRRWSRALASGPIAFDQLTVVSVRAAQGARPRLSGYARAKGHRHSPSLSAVAS
jgi:hypothetical protein